MKKTGKNKGLTLVDVVNHIMHFKQEMNTRFDEVENRVGNKIDRLDKRMDRMEQRIEWIDVHVMNIEGRLNTVEIAIIQQKHEPRLRRVERHLKLAKVYKKPPANAGGLCCCPFLGKAFV